MQAGGRSSEQADVEGWLRDRVAAELGVDPGTIDFDAALARQGLDSLRGVRILVALGDRLGRTLAPTLLYECPTIAALAARALAPAAETAGPAARTGRAAGDPAEPVAVVGLGCRLPGADGPEAFWSLLLEGRDATREIDEDRWARLGAAGVPAAGAPRRAGLLDQRPDELDAAFFGLSPREAEDLDPQQRLFLEVCWEALEHAGLAGPALHGSATGVFAGAIWSDFAKLRSRPGGSASTHAATGQALNMIANRVSHLLGLRGPSLVLDTACSSSLYAVHLACASLRSGEVELALAGGVNLLLDPTTMSALSGFGGLSPDGRCKAFAAAADGFGRGEGCGVVVLKRLSAALADGDEVWCTIDGSAVNNDGPSNGLTAPSPLAQRDVLRSAYAAAGVDPARVAYVETHGTGTALGDPIEAEALAAVLGGPDRARPLRLGAVKTNLGHLEGAAGITGLIKTALCLRHGHIPANLHFDEPNPHIAFEDLGLTVPSAGEAWEDDGARHAGVSSFGWGGTNVHAVLSAYTPAAAVPSAAPPTGAGHPVAFVCSPHGGQWAGMGRSMLATEPAFRAAVERCDAAFAPVAGWSLLDALHRDDLVEQGVDVVQPAIFAIQVGLAAWLEDAGVAPIAVTGHSLGEIAAAVIAGILDLEEAAPLVLHYSAQQARLAGQAAMAIVERPADEIRARIARERLELWVAAENARSSTNVVGHPDAVDRLVAAVRDDGGLAARIRVDVPAHAPGIEAVLPELTERIGLLHPRPGRIPMISGVTGRAVDWRELTASYFTTNLREPVALLSATAELVLHGAEALVEVGPHPVLASALAQTAAVAPRPVSVAPAMRREPDDRAAAFELAEAHAGPRRADGPQPVVLSAPSEAALRAQAHALAVALDHAPDGVRPAAVGRAAARRLRHPHRVGVLADSVAGLAEALHTHARGDRAEALVSARAPARPARVAFVFPGQGAQWSGMARELLATEPVFAAAVDACDAAIRPFAGFSVRAELEEGATRLDRIEVVQPLIFTTQVALAAQWASWGLRPDAVIGHSMGEVAAAHVAGALDLDEAARILCRRSALMARTSGQGAMLATELTRDEARDAIGADDALVSVAASNSPRSTVLSGDRPALERIAGRLAAEGVFHRFIKVEVASHSPQMDVLHDDLLEALEGIEPRAGEVPIYSTVTAQIDDGTGLDRAYWMANLREAVLFSEQAARLMEDGVDTFVELSPHPILVPALEQVAAAVGASVRAIASLRRAEPEQATLRRAALHLHLLGAPIGLERILAPAGRALRLPTYRWQRERHWPAELDGRAASAGGAAAAPDALPGTRLDLATASGVHAWEALIDGQVEAIADHRIGGRVTVPGAVTAAVVLACGGEVLRGPVELRDVTFVRPFEVPAGAATRMQTVIEADAAGGAARARVFGRRDGRFEEVAEALLAPADAAPPLRVDVDARAGALGPERDGFGFYRALAAAGLDYGSAYRGVGALRHDADEVLAELAPVGAASVLALPPALLDTALHAGLAALLDEGPTRGADGSAAWATSAVGRVVLHGRPAAAAWVHAVRSSPGAPVFDIHVLDAAGAVLVAVTGVRYVAWGETPAAPAAAALRSPAAPVLAPRATAPGADPLGDVLAAEAVVRTAVAEVLRTGEDRVDPDTPLRTLGLDSVMSLELRNRLERAFERTLSATVIWNHPTVRALAAFLTDGAAPARAPAPRPVATTARPPELPPHDGDLHDARAELERELSALLGEGASR